MANMSAPVLPPELLHIIFANLSNHADIYSLCLVSKCFYTVAVRFLYRRLKIPHRTSRNLTPLHAVLTQQQQEKLLKFSAGREDGLVCKGGRASGSGKELSDCGRFVKSFEVAALDGIADEVSEIGNEIIESAIENMCHLESFAWHASDPRGPRRTSRISASLARNPRLHSLSLSNILDTDVPLLQLRPLRSLTFTFDSNFVSLARRRVLSTADYDIIRKILKTSARKLKSLSLISQGMQAYSQDQDERLLFGGLISEKFPTGSPVTRLSKLESLTLVARLFTLERLEVLTRAIDFSNLRRLEIVFCDGAGLLLSAITPIAPPEGGELGGGARGVYEGESKIFPNLRTFRTRATQSAVMKFLQCFRGLQDLHYELECDPTDWAAPGGNRRQVSSIRISRDLLEAITTHHGNTLRRLTLLSFDQLKVIDELGMKILTEKCRVLEKLCCPVLESTFSGQPAATHAPSLSTLHLRLQPPIGGSEAYEFAQKILQQIPGLKTVRMLAGRDFTKPYAFRACPGGVVEISPACRFLQSGVRGWEVWGLEA